MSTTGLVAGRRSRLRISYMHLLIAYFKVMVLPLIFQSFCMPL